MARKMLAKIPHTRGPKRSRIAPTGRAETLVVIEASVKKKLRLCSGSALRCQRLQLDVLTGYPVPRKVRHPVATHRPYRVLDRLLPISRPASTRQNQRLFQTPTNRLEL